MAFQVHGSNKSSLTMYSKWWNFNLNWKSNGMESIGRIKLKRKSFIRDKWFLNLIVELIGRRLYYDLILHKERKAKPLENGKSNVKWTMNWRHRTSSPTNTHADRHITFVITVRMDFHSKKVLRFVIVRQPWERELSSKRKKNRKRFNSTSVYLTVCALKVS